MQGAKYLQCPDLKWLLLVNRELILKNEKDPEKLEEMKKQLDDEQ